MHAETTGVSSFLLMKTDIFIKVNSFGIIGKTGFGNLSHVRSDNVVLKS